MKYISKLLGTLTMVALSCSPIFTNAQDISTLGPDMDINAAPSGIRRYLTNYDRIGADLYEDVARNRIVFPQVGTFTRESLCARLVNTFNNANIFRPENYSNFLSNSSWVHQVIPTQACVDAMTNAVPSYTSKAFEISFGRTISFPVFADFPDTSSLPKVDFSKFTGIHRGTWYSEDGSTFNNPVMWLTPTESTNLRGVTTQSQTVEYLNRIGTSQANAVWGVNQSSSEGSAVAWNYDGKDNLNDGVILLFPFEVQHTALFDGQRRVVECAVLIKTEEAFLTCFNTIHPKTHDQSSYVRRAAAGFNGVGQWEISSRLDRDLALNEPLLPNELIQGRDSQACRAACDGNSYLCQFYNRSCEVKEQVYPSPACRFIPAGSVFNNDEADLICSGERIARGTLIRSNNGSNTCTLRIFDTNKFIFSTVGIGSRPCSSTRILRK